METDNLFEVGKYIEDFNTFTDQALPCGPIYQSKGLVKHTQRHHPDLVARVEDIPSVIQAPDFIGVHPKEPDSIELVKRMNGNVMVCVKLDKKENYLYVATVFEITEAKLNNRLSSGRLKNIDFSINKS